jgi:hypothetical protein
VISDLTATDRAVNAAVRLLSPFAVYGEGCVPMVLSVMAQDVYRAG